MSLNSTVLLSHFSRFSSANRTALPSDSPLSAVLRGEEKGRMKTAKPLVFTETLTPGPSPLSTGAREVALYY